MLNVTLSVEQPDTSRRRLAGADDSRTTLRVASDVEFSGEIMAGSITERFGSIDIGEDSISGGDLVASLLSRGGWARTCVYSPQFLIGDSRPS